jgi:chromosome segregation ATPase
MVEPIMYLAIGFLISMLCGLMIVPLVHNRAVRLTTRRLEAAAPLSMAEIQADKDQLRAEFAMSARKLEMSVEQLKAKTTSQQAEIGKKADAINRLKMELGEKSAAIFTLETREKALREQLHSTEQEFSLKTDGLRDAEQALREKQIELTKLSGELSDRSQTAESRQAELVTVRAQIETLQTRVAHAEQEHTDARARLNDQRGQSETASRELTDARSHAETLTGRLGEMDGQLLAQSQKAKTLAGRVEELEARLVTQDKVLVQREQENSELRKQIAAATGAEQAMRAQIAAAKLPEMETLRTGKAALEAEIKTAGDEREKLKRELAAAKQQADKATAEERQENGLLRERINAIAAEVAGLAGKLEGPDSPIQKILAAETGSTPPISAIVNGDTAKASAGAQGSLAQRIRALQEVQAARTGKSRQA